MQERGHCYVALRDAPRAIDAFLSAVNLNPALPASWRTLQSLYRMTGQTENAEMAGEHIATLAKLPPEIVTATALFSEGEFGDGGEYGAGLSADARKSRGGHAPPGADRAWLTTCWMMRTRF